jgi:hypothetical protein
LLRVAKYSRSARNLGALTTKPSTFLMPLGKTWTPLELSDVPVLVMVPSFLIHLWICKRVKGVCNFKMKKSIHCISFIRQMNVDYSICEAIKHFKGSRSGLIIYDVACQWWIHFLQRVLSSETLSIPELFKFIVAVGKFHLGAHIKECFYKFSLNFIENCGQVDGEVMETLWAILNCVSGVTRTMTKASRQELLDDVINDMNWKKLVQSGGSVLYLMEHAPAHFSVDSLIKKMGFMY